MMLRIARTLIALTTLALFSSPALAVEPIDGTYVDPGGYVEIRVGSCGNTRCGDITRIIRRKPGASLNDENNDNPALRDRPMLGLRILSDLRWDDGAWRGKVYNPEDGGTYRTEVRPRPNGSLEVKGCLAFFCRTQIWPAA